ncbi:MAG TPA: hypothetical protein V6D08_11600, partial [Candidatus Obscuribacterales bacterium]
LIQMSWLQLTAGLDTAVQEVEHSHLITVADKLQEELDPWSQRSFRGQVALEATRSVFHIVAAIYLRQDPAGHHLTGSILVAPTITEIST